MRVLTIKILLAVIFIITTSYKKPLSKYEQQLEEIENRINEAEKLIENVR